MNNVNESLVDCINVTHTRIKLNGYRSVDTGDGNSFAGLNAIHQIVVAQQRYSVGCLPRWYVI